MTKFRKSTTKEIYLSNESRYPPRLLSESCVVLHNIRSLFNVGSAFRTAEALGVSELILSGYTPYPPRTEISKTALGAEENVRWSYFSTLDETLRYLSEGKHLLIGVEQTQNSKSLPGYIWPAGRPVAIFFGNEVTGLDDGLLQYLDECVEIPLFGEKHSFNISVSIGIVLYDMLCKGDVAGRTSASL